MKDYELFTRKIYFDDRGYFLEQYNSSDYPIGKFKINQISESVSVTGTFRGFHFQIGSEMNKILRVVQGHAIIYLLNVYEDTPSLTSINLHELSKDHEVNYLYVPWYYAIGFITRIHTHMQYFHDTVFNENLQRCINVHSIPDTSNLLPHIKCISERDNNAMSWNDWKEEYRERMS